MSYQVVQAPKGSNALDISVTGLHGGHRVTKFTKDMGMQLK